MCEEKPDENIEYQGLLVLLQNVRANSENHMRQQWKILYYVLLLYASLVSISNLLNNKVECCGALATLAFIVWISGVYIIKLLEKSIRMNRDISFEIYKRFAKINEIINEHAKVGSGVSLEMLFFIYNTLSLIVTIVLLSIFCK